MPAKHTYEFVKASFESEGYVLLSKEYHDNKHHLECMCASGHQYKTRFDNWVSGGRCPFCYGNVKHKLDYIRKAFDKEGYTLFSTYYGGAKYKLSFMCPNGHIHEVCWADWKQGKRCYYCFGNVKPSFSEVKKEFATQGYVLLSKEYVNSVSKLRYICPKGHKHQVSWIKWKKGDRCPYCSKNIKYTYKEVKDSFEKEGYTLLSNNYLNGKSKLDYICPLGHKHSIRRTDWDRGHRCPTCAIINHTGPGSPAWKGGISYEDYCPIWKDSEYKESIKERDGHQCLNPDCWKKDGKLHVHHIDYDKSNCGPKNLITVCNSCNARANYQRTWHTAWYKAILYRRYNYE